MGRDRRQVDKNVRMGQAAEKAKRLQAKIKLVEYRVENDDVSILSGPYVGKTVRELWPIGSVERDYIVQNFCMRNDDKVMSVIRSLCGQ